MPWVHRFERARLAACGLLAVHAALLGWGAYVHSPTLNEPAHLVAGISYWKSGKFDVYCVNPPLVRLVAAMPVLLAGTRTDWHSFSASKGARMEAAMGQDLAAANGERFFWLMTLARWACVPFSLLGGYVCYHWAGKLYGTGAGLLALTLWCFCPNIIAHGQLMTCDAAGAAFAVSACYAYWRWLRALTWATAIMSGAVLGLGAATKSTLLILYPLLPAMWLIYRWPDRRSVGCREWLREAGMLLASVAASLYVINFAYGFEGAGTRLREYDFVSASLTGKGHDSTRTVETANRVAPSWLGALPLPLPKNYLIGIDLQRSDFERLSQPSYLRGQFRPRGWWYYYLYALAVKTPLGTLVLVFLAAFVGPRRSDGASARGELMVLSPALAVLAVVSSQTGFSEHMRYVLPIFPFAFIWASRCVATACMPRGISVRAIVAGAAIWSVASSLSVYPHSLAYFNELAGGSLGGPRHLISSNIDWGQDLLMLRDWLREHPATRPLNLAYFGPIDPRQAGVKYTWPWSPPRVETAGRAPLFNPQPGWYAVSVNFVRGFPRAVATGDGGHRMIEQGELVAFQTLRPVATIGYSIYVYRVAAPARQPILGRASAP